MICRTVSQPFLFFVLGTVPLTLAQCNNPNFVPCPPNDSSDLSGTGSGTGGGFSGGIGEGLPSPAGSSPVEGAAIDGIQGGDDDDGGPGFKSKRQAAFCCRPDPVQCLVLDNGLPACYNPDTTRYFFPDDSYYFASNNTFYFPNGTYEVVSAASGGVVASTAGPSVSAVIPGATAAAQTTSASGNEGSSSARGGPEATAGASGTAAAQNEGLGIKITLDMNALFGFVWFWLVQAVL